MNLTSLTGGLMMVALAGVWFVIFIPALSKRDQKSAEPSASRIYLTRRLGVLLGVGLVIALVVAAFAGQGLFVGGAVGVIALAIGATIGVRRLASRSSKQQAKPRRRVATGLTPDQAEPEPVIEYKNPRAWSAGEFPSQSLRPSYAKLESPTLADVVEFPVQQELSRETVDEIMRRRRAN